MSEKETPSPILVLKCKAVTWERLREIDAQFQKAKALAARGGFYYVACHPDAVREAEEAVAQYNAMKLETLSRWKRGR